MLSAKPTVDQNKLSCSFRLANINDASELVSSYENVFGKGGVRAQGYEAYPAPEVFSCDGIKAILRDANRDFLVAVVDGQIAGGMIVTRGGKYHREFGCVSINKKFQGRGISSLMLRHLMQMERETTLAINTTEIVTHSILSQAAHNRAGYDKIVGFGFCQYPAVFFADHPESCLWITSIEGRLAHWLRETNRRGIHDWCDLEAEDLATLTPEEQTLGRYLKKCRPIFVPHVYFSVTAKIIEQFVDIFSYEIQSNECVEIAPNNVISGAWLKIDLCEGEPYAVVTFPNFFQKDISDHFLRAWSIISRCGKRYVQARVPANTGAALKHIELLRQAGFVFLGLAPLFQNQKEDGKFDDIFLMQWIAPSVMANNELPGETNAVAKLYGYPLNATGAIVAAMRKDIQTVAHLAEAKQ